jgi:hemolysin III
LTGAEIKRKCARFYATVHQVIDDLCKTDAPRFFEKDEAANVVSHALGAAIAVPALWVLIESARSRADAGAMWSCVVFGASLLIVYAASTLYHSARERRLKCALEIADHSAIYLLIAGTYTPFLVRLGGRLGAAVLGAMWITALAGVLFKICCGCRNHRVSLLSYLVMGWFMVLLIKPLTSATSPAAMRWLVLGGLFYTAGVPFFVLSLKRMRYHLFWHLFVMAGSACHYIAVMFCVAPQLS